MRYARIPLMPLSIIGLLLMACVPARKYQELEARANAMEGEQQEALSKAREVQARYDEQQVVVDDLQKRIAQLERDTATTGTALRTMQKQYDKINALNDQLLDKYNKLLAGDRSENRKLLSDLEALRLDLQNKEDSIERSSKALAEREASLAELQAELARKDQAMRDVAPTGPVRPEQGAHPGTAERQALCAPGEQIALSQWERCR